MGIISCSPRSSTRIPRGEGIPCTASRSAARALRSSRAGKPNVNGCGSEIPWHVGNAVLQGHAAVLGVIIVSTILGGFVATLVIGSGIVASRFLVEMFNYYQHYGLVRVVGTAYDRRHLWNHLSPVSRLLGFEITNHSDHHMDAFVPYYRLQPDPAGPQMPSIFICFLAGLLPPIWFRWIAMPRLAHWDARFASEEERRLARAANRRAGWPSWLEDPR
jgi:hypothetical protein